MENTTTNPDVLERFLRYVQINTQSEDANCDQVPVSYTHLDVYKRQGSLSVNLAPRQRLAGSFYKRHAVTT